jgi:hypothetical protein
MTEEPKMRDEPKGEYESPEIEDLDTEANPAVTAAGGSQTDGVG